MQDRVIPTEPIGSIALAGERDPERVLKIARRYLKPDQRLESSRVRRDH